MMLAYRRGLLEPDYSQGLQSRIRERMILDMLAMEQSAEALMSSLLVRCTAVAPAIAPQSAQDFAEGFLVPLTKAAKLREYDLSETEGKEEQVLSESSTMLKAFNMLKERGIIEEFKKAAENAVANLQEDS